MTARDVRLTRRGWTLVGAAVGLLVGGRVLGADELSVLALAGIALLAAAAVWVAVGSRAVTVTRHVRPTRLQAGDTGRVELEVHAARPTGLVELVEIVGDGFHARFVLAPIAATPVVRAYRLAATRRGPLLLGPTTGLRNDPLGLAARADVVCLEETVLVRPRVFPIHAPRLAAGGRDVVDDGAAARAPGADALGEFLSVRPYAVGDDPRRVHWRSSARTDDLMVRQYVSPRRGRTLVVLDTRGPGAEPAAAEEAFERAVEAVASIVSALVDAGRPVECVTTGGSLIAHTRSRFQHTLDRLATVERDEPDLVDAVARSRRGPAEQIVVVTSAMDERMTAARRVLGRSTPSVLVITGGGDPDRTTPGVVVDARLTAFAEAWRAAHIGPRGRSGPGTPGSSWISAAPSQPPSASPR
jgi:uncharacterized protein (DUF58 family)